MQNPTTNQPPAEGGNSKTCPPWCVTDHDKPMTTLDGTPICLPDGRPMTWDGHESAHVWTEDGAAVSLGQMPGRAAEVLITAPPAGTAFLTVPQARKLAGVLALSGAGELADAIDRTLARLDGQDGADSAGRDGASR